LIDMMKNTNKNKVARTAIGIVLLGTGACILVVVLPYLVPSLIQWLKGYPAWLTFPIGFFVFGLGVFLAVSEYINAAKKAQETENNGYPEGCRMRGGKSHDGE
jgi:zinc transporter ZupT